MNAVYRTFGSEMSLYSVKVRSYFRCKRIPQQWLPLRLELSHSFLVFASSRRGRVAQTQPDGRGRRSARRN